MNTMWCDTETTGLKPENSAPFENLKLGTVSKALKVLLENTHDAMSDIQATRHVAIRLYMKGVTV